MHTILLFRPDGEPDVSITALAASIASIPGVSLSDGNHRYIPGSWRDEATGATCCFDIGEPPLEVDPLHPPRAYALWSPVGISVQIPLAGPHWFCVEALRLVEQLLALYPGWRALDTEDVVENDEVPPGPFPWDRLRTVACWERMREARIESLGNVPRMNRRDSVRLWRWRRERHALRSSMSNVFWPEGVAMLDRTSQVARSVAVWLDRSIPVIVPPVDLLVVPAGTAALVVSADQAATLCGGSSVAGTVGRLVSPGPDVDRFLRETHISSVEHYAALTDEDWSD